MNLELLIPYFNYIISGFIVLTVLYITTYIKEKAKSNALKKKNQELVDRQANHQRELEELKKEHQLDVTRRKYQYESKREQYTAFFKHLDAYQAKGYLEAQEKFMPAIEEFNRNYQMAASKGNKNGETKAATVLSKKTQALMLEANKELTKLKGETNTIRMIASDAVLALLDELEKSYDVMFELSSGIMKDFAALVVAGDQDGLGKNQQKMEVLSQDTIKLKNALIKKMREEFNEI